MLTEQRQDEVQAIIRCLTNYDDFNKLSESDVEYVAELIELGIYNHAVHKAQERHIQVLWHDRVFFEIYSNISYNVKVNLDIESSVNKSHKEKTRTYLVSKMYEFSVHNKDHDHGLLNPESLGAASSVDLNPYINQAYLDEINLRNQQGIVMKFSQMYRCNRCDKRKARVREIQSASLDEGSTLFITCIGCGNRWRQYS